MSDDSPLEFERQGAIVRLRFNQPDVLNALDAPTAQAFETACRRIAYDGGVRVVVMSGAGRAFVAGGDLTFMQRQPDAAVQAVIRPLHAGLAVLARINALVVASVHGVVAGAGLSLALAADLVIAAEGTRFKLAYANVGMTCDLGASWSLPRIVGLRRAMEIAIRTESIDAVETLRLDLVNRVVPSAERESQNEQLLVWCCILE